ncbi:vWA domain-containing protein [Bradyrhizobium sp. 2TAF24]|uniref:vWA domain-containing protein n=1 Tax=Bradyrhizobium sp. 2TAF24 TaxID=3233011 RepID=UPI003F93ADF9
MASLSSRLAITAKPFLRDRNGNVAITFAILIIPLLGLVGAAIDYSRANHARSAMQAALDATALMLSKDAANLTATELTARAKTYFNALYTRADAPNVGFSASYTAQASGGGSNVALTASGTLPTDFMKLAGVPKLDFSVGATAKWGITRLRVAMALDNTGSMQSANKMNALKSAATALIDQFSASNKTDGDVYISIVPFAKDVNVGVNNVNKSWLKWNGATDTWDENNGTCKYYNRAASKSACQNQGGTWIADNHNTWTGCVTDRDKNYDIRSDEPTSSATAFPAEQYGACPTELLPLTNNWSALKQKINAMQPSGNTNQAIGLAWAWLSLLQQSPLNAPALDPNYQYISAIILLSDGDNTQNRYSSNVAAIDTRQRLLCTNAKDAGIQIFTIQVNTDGSATSSVMQDCASPGNFYPTTTSSGIAGAFKDIYASLSKLRLAQ